MNENTDRKALESFLLDNPELAMLEALLDEFNLFEAIGAERQEVRHSDFLAFLLNPQEQHGLGPDFTQQLLLEAVQAGEGESSVTTVDLALWDLSDLQVRREWRHIDILLHDEAHQFVVIIENKVDSGEHSQQLKRYWRTVQQQFPGWHVLGLFLTPDGREPSDERYYPLDYALIFNLVNDLVQTRASNIGADVQTMMRHYAQMLRRHIMPDSDIAQLAQRIYQKHQRALDLIFEHRPDLQAEMRKFLEEMIINTPGIILDHSTKTSIRFLPEAWDKPILQQGKGWGSTNRMLLFEFDNRSERLSTKLYIGPGPQPIREKLFALFKDHQPPFQIRRNDIQGKWRSVHVVEYLRSKDFEGAALDEITPKIEQKWYAFLDNTLPKLTTILKSASWLREEE